MWIIYVIIIIIAIALVVIAHEVWNADVVDREDDEL